MRILQQLFERLEGYEPDKDYFEYPKRKRQKVISHLWDTLYGDLYRMSIDNGDALDTHYHILTYLQQTLKDFEGSDEYEACDVILELINITEDKIQQIDADTN